MSKFILSNRLWFALAIWAIGLLLFLALAMWNLNIGQRTTEDRLLTEAGRIAAQLSALMVMPSGKPDSFTAKAIVSGAMEDEHIYAVKIENHDGMKEGSRRNHLWEPIPWDNEIADNCIQGMTPLRYNGKNIGSVEVWLSPRQINEEESQLFKNETVRFCVITFFWTLAIFSLLWIWGELKRIRRNMFFKNKSSKSSPLLNESPNLTIGLSRKTDEEEKNNVEDKEKICDKGAGRLYQRKNPDSWLVTAGLFRQTFLHGSQLLIRLYANGEYAGLCHLGRMLEQAAPCLGAKKLTAAARNMQEALNNPESKDRASAVEKCANALEEVLDELGGEIKYKN